MYLSGLPTLDLPLTSPSRSPTTSLQAYYKRTIHRLLDSTFHCLYTTNLNPTTPPTNMATTNQQPITPERFASALESLPIDSLHAKAAEIQNSITQLKSSNDQMLPFADEGDDDCREAMFENLGVITRFNERISLIKAEVEKRGLPWAHSGENDKKGGGMLVNGDLDGDGEAVVVGRVEGRQDRQQQQSGRLTDEELRRRMEEQMGGSGGQEDEGVHL